MEDKEMMGVLEEIYLYKGSNINNSEANYIIDIIYREKKLIPINIELQHSRIIKDKGYIRATRKYLDEMRKSIK